MTNNANLKLSTRVIHGGQSPDPSTGAVMVPIYATSTYVQESPGVHQGYDYSRAGNPTRAALEACLANLESGTHGFAFASGMAAVATVLELLQAGDHIIVTNNVYGGTYRLFEHVRKRSAGLQFTFMDFTDLQALEAAILPNTRMIWLETPTNPLLKLIDLTQIAAFAKKYQLLSVVDNTFATPMAQRPLEYGFDLVLHSTTKYLNGHSDVIGGAVVVNSPELAEKMAFLTKSIGGIASPFDSFLTLRGIKTLAIRMQRHTQSALMIAEWLQHHPKVGQVYYPGLPNSPQYPLAQRQMAYFGGMISFTYQGDDALAMLSRCQIFTLAESLGGVESLISHPATMTHASIPPETRQAFGITDHLIRLSVGLEDCEDLIQDLKSALS
ncbi:MAG: PLP-dependent aspartate aminotransferase family protein [Gammaproteobacteria bacterium]